MNDKLTQISEKDFNKIESSMIWCFTTIGCINLPKIMFQDFGEIISNSMIGQHLGIITDRRGSNILTNIELHHERKGYFFSDKFKNSWMKDLRKLILSRFYYNLKENKKIILTDLPLGNYGVDIIVDTIQKSKNIIFLNDPVNVMNFKINDFIKNKKSYSEEQRTNFIKMESKKIGKMYEMLININRKNEQNTLVIYLNDLFEKTNDELEKIFKFVEIVYSESELKNIRQKIVNELKNKKKKFEIDFLSKEEKKIIEEIFTKNMQGLQ